MGLFERAAAPPQLKALLNEKLSSGTYSELVEARMELAAYGEKGLGYRTTKDVNKGDVLLFDSAACWSNMPTAEEQRGTPLNFQGSNDPHKKMAVQMRQRVEPSWAEKHVMTLKVGVTPEKGDQLAYILGR